MKTLWKAGWLDEFSYEETIEILTDLAWSHIQLAGPFRTKLGALLSQRDWRGMLDFKLDYGYELSPMHLYHARQALAFFQKLEPLELGIDKEQVAYGKFCEAEKLCKQTNRILRLARKGLFCFQPYVERVFHTAQRKIAQVLGPVPSLNTLQCGFGPGATTTTKKESSCIAVKLVGGIACSTNLVPSVTALAQQAPHWFFANAHACDPEKAYVDVAVHAGRLQFVPKNAKTYRSILIEPVLNGFFQRGVGRYIRERLKRVGVTLDDQSRNRILANAGSRTGALATLDLSSASDTVSKELVYELLPLDWACFLAQFRTSRYSYQGVEVPQELEKFSSMGNGFTFELESLIFWALSVAVLEVEGLPKGWLAIYGDDIIVPTEAVQPLKTVLTAAGFLVNSEKSYWNGPFRESCGADYFLGTDIRPYYQKGLVSGETLFVLHNYYYRRGLLSHAKRVAKRYIHPSLRIYGPDAHGDGHLLGGHWGYTHKNEVAAGWEGMRFDTYSRMPRRLKRVPRSDFALPTYCVYTRASAETPFDPSVLSGSEGYRRISVYTLQRP